MKKKLNRLLPIFLLILNILTSFLSPTAVHAADADHSGSVFINVFPQPGSGTINAFADGTATKNKLFAQDTMKSAEWVTTGLVFANSSVQWNESILDSVGGEFPKDIFPITPGMFSAGGQEFEQKAVDLKWSTGSNNASRSVWDKAGDMGGAFFNSQSRVLTMTVPGWTASNDYWNPSGEPEVIGKRSESDLHRTIPADAGAAVANIIETLIGGYNEAVQYFDSYVTLADGTRPTYDNRGFLAMATHVARGEMPAPGSKVIYNPDDATFKFKRGTVKLVGNPDLKASNRNTAETSGRNRKSASSKELDFVKQDGVVLAYMEVSSKSGDSKIDSTTRFPYIVTKAPSMTGTKYNGDVYALSFMDVLVSMAGSVYVGEGVVSDSSSNTSVVSDQVNGWLYDMVTAALGLLGIKTADELVFGQEGNLFKNDAYFVYLAILAPFIVVAILILMVSIAEAFRKSQLQYINTQQAGDVQNSVGNIVNALLQIALLPEVVRIFVYIDQVLVDFALSLHAMLNQLIGYHASGGRQGVLGTIGDFLGSGIMNVVIVIIIAGVNIKYTWRYIARVISFAMYFVLAPVQFALDSFSGNGQILQMGRRSADTWKNLLSLSLMRGVDALGVVFATTIGRLLFGNGILISVIAYMTIENVTDMIRSSFGLTNATISGIAEAGTKIHGNVIKGAATSIGMGVASAATGGYIGRKSEANRIEAQQEAQLEQAARSKQIVDGGGTNRRVEDAKPVEAAGGGSQSFNEEVDIQQTSTPHTSESGTRVGGSAPGDSTVASGDTQSFNDEVATSGGSEGGGGGYVDNIIGSAPRYTTVAGGEGGGEGYPVDSEGGAPIGQGHVDQQAQPEITGGGYAPENYDLAMSRMQTDPTQDGGFNYGADLSNSEIDPNLSRVHTRRTRVSDAMTGRAKWKDIGKEREYQNIVDQKGNVVSGNVDYTNSKHGQRKAYWDTFWQGYDDGGYRGIAGDPNTEKTMSGFGYQVKMKYSGPEHWALDERGKPKPISKEAKREYRSRLAAATAGGVVSALTPRNIARWGLASAAMMVASLTDGKFDDALVKTSYAAHLQSRATGRNKGLMASVGNSLVGRMLRVNPHNLPSSRVNTLRGSNRQSQPNSNMLSSPATYQTKDDETQGTRTIMSQPNPHTARKASDMTGSPRGQRMLKDINTIRQGHKNAFEFGENGNANITTDSLKNIIKTSDNKEVKESAANLMDTIETNGMGDVVYNQHRNEIGSRKDYQHSETYDADAIKDDAGLGAIKTAIERDPMSNGYYHSKTGSEVYRYDKQTGELKQFSEPEEMADVRLQSAERSEYRDILSEIEAPESEAITDEMYTASNTEEFDQSADKANNLIGETMISEMGESSEEVDTSGSDVVVEEVDAPEVSTGEVDTSSQVQEQGSVEQSSSTSSSAQEQSSIRQSSPTQKSSSTEQPSTTVQQPSQPSPVQEQSSTRQSNTTIQQSSPTTQQSSTTQQQSSTTTQQSSSTQGKNPTRQSSTTTQQSNPTTQQPSSTTQQPSSTTQQPNSTTQQSSSNVKTPRTNRGGRRRDGEPVRTSKQRADELISQHKQGMQSELANKSGMDIEAALGERAGRRADDRR